MFRAFKDAHLQINDFGYGPVSDISTATEMEFPYMWVTHTQPSVINYKRHSQIPSWNFSFLFLDQINQQTNHSEENGLNTDNQEDIMSDQFQIAQDFLIFLGTLKDYGVMLEEQTINAEPFFDETTDKVSGFVMSISVKTIHSNCVYPTTVPQIVVPPVTCKPVSVKNSDGSYTFTVDSGGSLTLPDITHTQSDGSAVTLPAQTPLVCTPGGVSGDGFVTSSNGVYTQAVAPETTVTLPDITHTDSDGSTVVTPAQAAFTATQCPTLVDGTVVNKDTDGNVLHTTVVANNGSVDKEIADSNITNSTGTFNDTVLAEGSKTLADITHTDSDGTSVVVSAQTPFVASICPVIVLPYGYTRPLNYQTTTTYSNGDDGANNINNIDTYVFNHLTEQCPILDKNNFLNMISVNSFGNNYRFTSRDGGYYDESDGTYRTVDGTLTTFDDEFKDGNDPIVFAPYIVDNYTGVGYVGRVLGAATFIQTISTFLPGYNSIGNNRYLGYTDYKIPSLAEACSIRDNTTSGARVARSSFGFIADSPYFDLIGTIMTATVNPRSTTQNYNVLDRSIVVGSTARTSAATQVTLCRYHFPI